MDYVYLMAHHPSFTLRLHSTVLYMPHVLTLFESDPLTRVSQGKFPTRRRVWEVVDEDGGNNNNRGTFKG